MSRNAQIDMGFSQAIKSSNINNQGFELDTGDTTAMVLHNFNGNGMSDLITINRFGTVQFFKKMAGTGLVEVGTPLQAHGAGPLKVMDVLHNHQRDLIVEVAPGIEQVIDVGDIFGPQPIIVSGKRAIRYAFFDHLGSARMLTDNQGKVVWPSPGGGSNRLMPFGKDPYFDGLSSDTVKNSYLLTFTNKEIDYYLDLHYFGARYYHSTFPRFISPDPISGNPMNPISWNRYLYCRNDPVNYFDPDGRDTKLAQGHYTEGNPLGHIAWVINGTVYSHNSRYSGGSDWGVSEVSYFTNADNDRGGAQNDLRETTLYTLNISEDQEQTLEQYLQSNDPNGTPYDVVTNSCVTSTEQAAEATNILPNNTIIIISPQGFPMVVPVTSQTPADLVNQFQNADLIQSSETQGTKPKLSGFRAIAQAVVNFFTGQ